MEDLDSVRNLMERSGQALGIQAEIVACIEWSMDKARAAAMRAELSLSEEEHAELLEKFRLRNREVWGAHSRTEW